MIEFIVYTCTVYVGIRVLYTIFGIIYEWFHKDNKKGFTLNLVATIILSIMNLTVFYQLYLRFKRRHFSNVMSELSKFELEKAAARDQTGNTVHHTLLNKYLIPPYGYKFGDKDETVSGVLGINQVLGYITDKYPIGKVIVDKLEMFEEDHCRISIDVNNIRWSDLNLTETEKLMAFLKERNLI